MTTRHYSSVLFLFLAVAVTAAAAPTTPCPAAVPRVAARVAQLDGLKSLVVPCEEIPPDAVGGRLRAALEKGLSVPLEAHVEALLRLGVIDGSDPATVTRAVLDFYRSQVLGYYDSDSHEMVLVSGGDQSPDLDSVLAHELEHAAQEVRYRLPSRIEALAGNGDAQRAAAAVAEGDAIVTMVALAGRGGRPEPAELAAAADQLVDALGSLDPQMPEVPHFVVADTLFPYVAGTRLVVERLRAGGWDAVEEVLRHPPQSTEQLLHPERCDDPPQVVPEGALPPLPAGSAMVYRDVVGEWALRTWLTMAVPADVAAETAAGWGGDLLRVSRAGDDDGGWRVDWALRWDTPADAAEAADVLRVALPTLFARLGRDGADVTVDDLGDTVLVRAMGRSLPPVGGGVLPLPAVRTGG